ncbi:MAG: alpha/beta hydrolase [Acholeplasmatales bacterium]|nr:alpha/beta hydrolase [Acholeplasmatales bacterium]
MLNLVKEWDKCFPKNEKVNHKKVTFKNHFGIELAADMFWPKDINGKLPAIACSGAFGAVKEQHSGLYAQEMASRGFLTIAFDPSFTGESAGEPRYMNSPDINVEDFQASVDYLSNLDNVDKDKISIIGICGWGGMAIQTACIDTRIKATVAITMYDMSRVAGNGYYDSSDNEEARYQMRVNLNNQRTEDFKNDSYKLAGGTIPLDVVKDMDVPVFVKEYSEYYRNRAYHLRSLNSNNGWNISTGTSLLNTRLFTYASEIRSAVLIVHGENAHSRYMGEDTFKLLKGENKELFIVSDANHTDLYDGGINHDKIPFDKIEEFIKKNI